MNKILKWTLRLSGILLLLVLILGIAIYTQLPKQIGTPPKLQTGLFEKPKTSYPMEGRFIYRSASELAKMIKSGEATSVEIVREYINNIKNNNWKYNAIVWLREEEALLEAKLADEKVSLGDTTQPLLGVPVTIKEQFGLKGFPCTLNAKRLGIIAREDAEVVKQIKNAGAIIIGSTNLSLMVSYNETFGEIYPTGNNPFDTTRTPGGSTGGGAAALAAGFTALSLGADAGGSIRIPAAFCGVYGFKPSFGAINITKGVMPFELMKGSKFGIASAGPLARTAEDLEMYWQILMKTPIDNRFQEKINWQASSEQTLEQYNVAWMDEWQHGDDVVRIGSDVKSKLNSLIESLKKQGVFVTKDAPDTYDEMYRIWGGMLFQVTTQDENWLVRKVIKMSMSKMDNGDEFFDEIGTSLDDNSTEYWNKLLTDQKLLIEKIESFFKNYNFLVLPLTYGPAFTKCNACAFLPDENGEPMHYIDYFPYAAIFNASGHPAVVVPMGLNADGLPIGIQIVGPMFSDPKLLHFIKLLKPLIPGFAAPTNSEF